MSNAVFHDDDDDTDDDDDDVVGIVWCQTLQCVV